MAADDGTYLYAVTCDPASYCPKGLVGVAGRPVRAVEDAGLVAYVSTVPLAEFGEEPLRRQMEDLDWLGETARAHHRVVEAVAEVVPAAPVRLVTVYTDDEQVRELLRARRDDFAEVLSNVAGREEWGVKAYVDTAELSAAEPEGAEGDDSPGKRYLRRRQASLRTRDDLWRQAAAHAERIHDVLSSVAVAGRRHRMQDPQLSGRAEMMVLNGAYLVDHDRGEEFARVLDGLREKGIEVELTGPWAPYSFTALAEPAEPGTSGDRA
ncbi:gas vesicle protein [Microtetraspora sp. NBRC 13810]|uniref:GvpL/GvpF family gas vesicle protein n=1 Tax=Microtetraspora sp. NBRC 13810 TaxID=3030990 RepID=UPI0024A08A4D|nr:GvpL/GvpF family gas vesicle protein [Microtetraspora sp. NBRC 13810]GLW11961.1 gas vesicle protein [Microtetraspora sp. NBRC 13810]